MQSALQQYTKTSGVSPCAQAPEASRAVHRECGGESVVESVHALQRRVRHQPAHGRMLGRDERGCMFLAGTAPDPAENYGACHIRVRVIRARILCYRQDVWEYGGAIVLCAPPPLCAGAAICHCAQASGRARFRGGSAGALSRVTRGVRLPSSSRLPSCRHAVFMSLHRASNSRRHAARTMQQPTRYHATSCRHTVARSLRCLPDGRCPPAETNRSRLSRPGST